MRARATRTPCLPLYVRADLSRCRVWTSGNATEPLLYMAGALLTFCALSGKWWLLLYALAGVAVFAVVLLFALYLEYNAQSELERRAKEQARSRKRFGTRI